MQAKRILLVEDDASLNMLLQDYLVDEGYACTAANSADAALPFLKSESFDLVISDIDMPGALNGIDLAVEVRASSPALPVILMSGSNCRDEVHSRTQVSAFLSKPFGLKLVSDAIESVFGQPASRANAL